jgi:hypothetical protein
MEKKHLLTLVTIMGVILMLISFVVVPDEYPWYYELLLFNAGLWPWLFAKNALKNMKSQQNTVSS